MKLKLKDTFTKELPADQDHTNVPRQVYTACFSSVTPRKPSNPSLIHVSKEMADELGIEEKDLDSEKFLQVVTGGEIYPGSSPYAMCYGGHQFGHWAGQLGDGRAINLMEVESDGMQWALQLKGAGETPYSRTADGLAVLRSSIREHLCSEAMFHLGVPTTRSLSLSLTGDQVLRDVMYNGNAAFEKGAVVCRVSPSFIRFGSFEIFANRGDIETLKALTDYTIKHHFPTIQETGKKAYTEFFQEVTARTLEMVIHWQRVGFVHGVMNTDNMSILGLTIDYGPYGWLENYDPEWTPNTTDRQMKRYRFGQQGNIALWNLLKLANALYPLIEASDELEQSLKFFQANYRIQYSKMMANKIGIEFVPSDESLIIDLEKALMSADTDMTIFFRKLALHKKADIIDCEEALLALIGEAFYEADDLTDEVLDLWYLWFANYNNRLQNDELSDKNRRTKMDAINPKYVFRNYMAQLAIDAADKGDHSIIEELHELLKRPYSDQQEMNKWAVRRPEWAKHKVGCSMLSCSS